VALDTAPQLAQTFSAIRSAPRGQAQKRIVVLRVTDVPAGWWW
jgi:hypothetical protein